MIECIDEGVGRILASLGRLNIADDTIVIFTSDHGDMMGDHGLILKGAMHFQGCLRVPLAIHLPGAAPARTDSLASSVDVAQTMLELCHAPAYQGMQGRSLAPILTDPAASVRDAILVEDGFPARELGRGLPLKTRTIINGRGRYTRDSDSQEQMFDLSNDPDELTDLTIDGRDQGRRADMVPGLTDMLIAADDICRPEPVSL